MLPAKFLPLVLKQTIRRPMRTALTILGVATAMFLFAAVQTLQQGVTAATRESSADTTLVVYRANRYCPSTSRLPEAYHTRLERLPGVTEVVPIKVVVNNCRASLDVVTFRGVPAQHWAQRAGGAIDLIDGSLNAWLARSDAALLGETLARRRGLSAGDRFDAAGVTVTVAGVFRSDEPQDQNVAYVHLDFLQRAAGRGALGVVTQFNVKVAEPSRLDEVARAIDAEFAQAPEPTQTSSEKAFVSRAVSDVIHLVSFTRYLGWGALAAVLALVANAVVLNVQDRVKEHAVLQTLGFTGSLVARMVITEGLTLGLLGGAMGAAAAVALVAWGGFTLSAEGLSIPLSPSLRVLGAGLLLAAAIGVLASLVPALRVSRRPIVESFRAV